MKLIFKTDDKIVIEFNSNEKSTVSDLYPILNEAYGYGTDKESNPSGHLFFLINGDHRIPIDGFNLNEFISLNNLDPNNILIHYTNQGFGNAVTLEGNYRFEIRTSEANHRNKPHIHISADKGKNYTAISLNNNEILNGKKHWDRIKGKDKKELLKTISENKDGFIQFYDSPFRGLQPISVSFIFKGKEYYLE